MSESDHLEYCKYLDARLCSVAKRRCELDVEEASLLRAAEEMKLWRVFGHASLLEYMERAMGYQPHTARERLRVARALEQLPQLAEALSTGRVCHSVVREVAAIANADTETAWLDQIEGKSCREVEKLVAGHKPGDRPDDPTDPDLRTRRLELVLGPEAFAAFREGRVTVQRELGRSVTDDELIAMIFRRALVAPADGTVPSPAYRRSIKTCDRCRRHWESGGGRDIEVSDATASTADCDAELLGSLDADVPTRITTTVTPRKRKQVFERDGNCCAVPGCRSTWNLDIHHLLWQVLGGDHELANLMLVCGGHHGAIHNRTLLITGQAPHAIRCEWVRLPSIAEELNIDDDDDAHADAHDAAPSTPSSPLNRAATHIDPTLASQPRPNATMPRVPTLGDQRRPTWDATTRISPPAGVQRRPTSGAATQIDPTLADQPPPDATTPTAPTLGGQRRPRWDAASRNDTPGTDRPSQHEATDRPDARRPASSDHHASRPDSHASTISA